MTPTGPSAPEPGRRARASVILRLEPEAASVRTAREALGEALLDVAFEGDGDLVVLLTSEVVTNAVRHTETPIEISAVVDRAQARVRVVDGDPDHLPRLEPVTTHAALGGRGMHIVDELSQEWGVDVDTLTKAVWFTVA